MPSLEPHVPIGRRTGHLCLLLSEASLRYPALERAWLCPAQLGPAPKPACSFRPLQNCQGLPPRIVRQSMEVDQPQVEGFCIEQHAQVLHPGSIAA
ncbi:hypothetical protein VTH82DRAFT_5121 [Thermothelomyces myriococcoides]